MDHACGWLVNATGSGARLVFTSLDGGIIKCALCYDFSVTNNKVEYEALLVGLREVVHLGIRHL